MRLAGRSVLWLGRGQQRPVDAVPGHQLGRLAGERLGLGGGDALGLCLGQQLAHPLEQRARRIGCQLDLLVGDVEYSIESLGGGADSFADPRSRPAASRLAAPDTAGRRLAPARQCRHGRFSLIHSSMRCHQSYSHSPGPRDGRPRHLAEGTRHHFARTGLVNRQAAPDVGHADQPVQPGVGHEDHVRVRARGDGRDHSAGPRRQHVRHLPRPGRQIPSARAARAAGCRAAAGRVSSCRPPGRSPGRRRWSRPRPAARSARRTRPRRSCPPETNTLGSRLATTSTPGSSCIVAFMTTRGRRRYTVSRWCTSRNESPGPACLLSTMTGPASRAACSSSVSSGSSTSTRTPKADVAARYDQAEEPAHDRVVPAGVRLGAQPPAEPAGHPQPQAAQQGQRLGGEPDHREPQQPQPAHPARPRPPGQPDQRGHQRPAAGTARPARPP